MDITLKKNTIGGNAVIRLFKDQASPRSYKEYTCLVVCGDREYRADFPASDAQVKDILRALLTLKISPFARCPFGIDGTGYELTIDEGFSNATYHWWLGPEEGWQPLAEIAGMILNLGFKCRGSICSE